MTFPILFFIRFSRLLLMLCSIMECLHYTLFFSFSQYFGKRKLWRLQFYKKKTENNPNGLCRIFLRCFPVCFRACLKKAFRELRVPVCGRFYPNEGGLSPLRQPNEGKIYRKVGLADCGNAFSDTLYSGALHHISNYKGEPLCNMEFYVCCRLRRC